MNKCARFEGRGRDGGADDLWNVAANADNNGQD